MKKVLVLVSTILVSQGSLLGWSEYEAINKKASCFSKHTPRKYEHFSFKHTDIERSCESAPRGWFGKYNVETACDILHDQFYEISEAVKTTIKDSAKDSDLKFDQFVLEHKKLLTKEEIASLVEIVLNKESASEVNSLIDLYERHFDCVVKNKLRGNRLQELLKKYSN